MQNAEWTKTKTKMYRQEQFAPIDLLCGGKAYFDESSGISYRCETCGAVVGSVGMPQGCKELYDMETVIEKLKGTHERR